MDIELQKIDGIKVYIKTTGQIAARINANGTATRDIFWVPRVYLTIGKLCNDYSCDEKLIDLLRDLGSELDIIDAELHNKEVFHKNLRPYQNLGVHLIREYKTFGLFWQQRSGKTPTTCIALENTNKVMIVVPAGHQLSWLRRFQEWTNRTDMVILKGTPKKRLEMYNDFDTAKTQILIASVDTVKVDMQIKFKRSTTKEVEQKGIWTPKIFDTLVLDEAHFLRNTKNIRSQAMYKLRKYAKNAIALTGTPATNHAHDVIPILNFLYPNKYPKWPLLNYFFDMVKNRFSGYGEPDKVSYEREEEWVELIHRKSQLLRLNDIVDWLPKVVRTVVPLEASSSQEKHMKLMLNEFKRESISGKIIREENVLTRIIRMIQIGVDPYILDLKGKSAKTQWLKTFVEDNDEEPVIIWSTSTKYLKHLKKEVFKDALQLNGQMSAMEKNNNVDAFQAGQQNIILINIQAGKEGWTLDRASTSIFVNRDWNPTNNDQADFRFIPTTKDNVNGEKQIIDLVLGNSMDEHVAEAIRHKKDKTYIVNNFTEWVERGQ